MDTAQLLQWLIPATGMLIATLWGLMHSEISRLRSKLESVHEKAHQDALLLQADKLKLVEIERALHLIDGHTHEHHLSENDVERIVTQLLAQRFELLYDLAKRSIDHDKDMNQLKQKIEVPEKLQKPK